MSPEDQMKYRLDIPTPPPRIAKLPIQRGYPVPFFVLKMKNEEYDFRILDLEKVKAVMRHNLCWICGEPLGAFKAFIGGPLMSINRMSGEGPCHRECAVYALKACPFMVKKSEAREAGMPPGSTNQMKELGQPKQQNPGVSVMIITKSFQIHPHMAHGWIIGPSEEVSWWTEGRAATRKECEAGMMVNLPGFREIAKKENQLDVLEKLEASARLTFPPE